LIFKDQAWLYTKIVVGKSASKLLILRDELLMQAKEYGLRGGHACFVIVIAIVVGDT
jgi:hypothetical protein